MFLKDLTQLEGWKVLLRELEGRIGEVWIDPTEAKDNEDFLFRYTAAWASRKWLTEMVEFVNKKISEAEYLDDKRKGKVDRANFNIGE